MFWYSMNYINTRKIILQTSQNERLEEYQKELLELSREVLEDCQKELLDGFIENFQKTLEEIVIEWSEYRKKSKATPGQF